MEIINGLQIDIPGKELQHLLMGRLQYHQNKADLYEKQLVEFVKFEQSLADEARSIGKTSNATPKESVEQAVKKHQNQVVYYKFMADHIVMTATYRLTESDLIRIGVQDRGY